MYFGSSFEKWRWNVPTFIEGPDDLPSDCAFRQVDLDCGLVLFLERKALTACSNLETVAVSGLDPQIKC